MSLRASAERWLTARWYGAQPIVWLIPLSAVYAALLGLRALLRRVGWQRPQPLRAPVIVVGNLTVGGTGKTPFVIWLARELMMAGFQPGIVTRGHGGAANRQSRPVTGGESSSMVGDEPLVLVRRAGCPVHIGRDRHATAADLLRAWPGVDVIIADDGLEHRRLPRVLEVVMLDGQRGLGNGWWLPAGPLREPAARLHSADLVIATGQACAAQVDAPVMHLEPAPCVRLSDGTTRELRDFSGGRVHAVAGIGHPERFFAMLQKAGLAPESHPLPDHAPLTATALAFGSDAPVLLTEKDAVRLDATQDPRLWMVPVTASFRPHDHAAILDTVRRKLLPAEPHRS